MSVGMYEISVPVYVRMLTNLSAVLTKGEEFAKAQGIAESELINSRLHEDMFPLSRQIQIASDAAKGMAGRLSGAEVPSMEDTETTFADLQARIAKTIAFLNSVDAKAFEGSEGKTIEFANKGGSYSFTGKDFLLTFANANFYFHVTTAYDILRSKGVQLGKKDYLGAYNA